MSPLVSLPPELLVQIFFFAIQPKTRHGYPEEWVQVVPLMCVCRYWREVACNASVLWCTLRIHVKTSSQLLRLHLDLSRNLPLDVYVRLETDSWDSAQVVDVDEMLSDLHRVQLLHIDVGSEPEGPRSIAIEHDMPNLQKLVLWSNYLTTPLLPSDQHHLPCLHTLEAETVKFSDLTPFLRPTITNLHIGGDSYDFPDLRPSLPELLLALSTMPLLERLVLNFTVCDLVDYNSADLPFVTLPRVRHLEIMDDCLPAGDLLEHLIVHPSSFLVGNRDSLGYHGAFPKEWLIRGYGHLFGFEKMLRVLSSKLLGHGILGPAPSPLLRDLTLAVWRDNYSESVVEAFHEDVGRQFLFSYRPDPGYNPSTHVDCVLRSLDGSILQLVTKLHVEVPEDVKSEEGDEHPFTVRLEDIAERLPNIEELRVSGKSTWDREFVRIHTSPQAIPFPRLQHMVLKKSTFRKASLSTPDYVEDPEDLIWTLLEMLKVRKAAGIPIQRLTIETSRRLLDSDEDALRPYVRRISFAYIASSDFRRGK
ncbi:hypothetical protein EIP91_010889 [Steccherinum ochraceum]|uniref:F-box domain-containing protein n=1 Tax=Steccherinum ochraceum TaxID=92696 RepID=A0A4R0RIG7_9APHY|nr:hypothetical protein EIP91_010889 [Steccherinum ochraceum]